MPHKQVFFRHEAREKILRGVTMLMRGAAPPGRLAGACSSADWTGLGIFGLVPVDHGTYFYASTHAERLASAIALTTSACSATCGRRRCPWLARHSPE